MSLSEFNFVDFARCKDNKNIDFHSENYSMIRRAIAFCNQCPVIEQCKDYAIRNNITYGVWGGTTGPQRRRIKLNS